MTTDSSPDTSTRPLRADAERNREKILAAATLVFAQRGLDASLDEVAAAAGVGVGTVYRRFPDKDALISALFEDAISAMVDLANDAARRGETSWDSLVWFLEQALARQCANRGLREVIMGAPHVKARMTEVKDLLMSAFGDLIVRAQRDGYLRDDVVLADFPLMELMVSYLGNLTANVDADLWRRYLVIILDGLAVSRERPSALGPRPTDDVLDHAMHSGARAAR